ncbi:MAG TPA: dehydrogenase [Flavobacteriales bacterium]|nr:dehydrogenase [Flavobacteriales bacterium]HRE75492.1 dehydrogenase E1 component subunit alpha/beta [Flavobacteriales bacterium]HRJ34743.1 dehydrogenase E1 component subunit alpha/beta [Flavobacteriales bacterium]HRJ37705.1 dehydrogenase E1 component subunit alpha/beta [Flavobacteriales bacterium]
MSATANPVLPFDRKTYSNDQLIELYNAILLPRLIEEKMLILLRQGRISKWFSGYGQEGISVGTAMAIAKEEYILPMHRNLGVFTSRGIPLHKLFAQFQGKEMGFTKGRDRSFHFGTKEHKVVGMISHLGPQLGIADGIALAHKLRKEERCTLVYSGDGGASEGDFHESINVAAVWDLPVIFVIENNQWGLSTPSNEQFRCKQFIDKAIGYGIEGIQVDGNNILEVYDTTRRIAEDIRKNPRPVLLECITFRMRGHEEASGTKYYPEGLQEKWSVKDPVDNFESWLISEKIISAADAEKSRMEIKKKIADELEIAFAEPNVEANTARELADVYAPHNGAAIAPKNASKTEKRFIDAVSDGLRQAMQHHPNLVLMGQDIAEYGGVFKVTENFVAEFGKDRVRNTPLCESAIIGTALGLSINGHKAMSEMQFADFVTCGFNQIVNNLAKIHYRWGQNADVVVRMPTGAGVGAGPFHSQSNEAWFFHTPGLKVVYPAFPNEAKGLLLAAFADPNPVIFFEHKALYRSVSEEVNDDYFTLEIGKAAMVAEGNDVSIVTYGMGVHWALEVTKELGISADIVNLRTLLPLDTHTIYASVRKTGRVLVLHEDCMTGGIGGELSALITEHCFESLDAPVVRVASLDSPVPFAIPLENDFLPKDRFKEKLKSLLNY